MKVILSNPSESQVHFILSSTEPCDIYRITEVGEDKFDLGFMRDKENIIQLRLKPGERRSVETKTFFFFASAFLEFCGTWYNIFRDQKASVSRDISILPKYYKKIIV